MKKLINRADDLLAEALEGFAAAHADLVRVQVGPGLRRPCSDRRERGRWR